MTKDKICNSCKKKMSNPEGSASFPCPGCGNETIHRCSQCRTIATRYKCHSCGFEGPN